MSTILFPVCAYAAIHYEGRRLMNELLRRKTITGCPKKNDIEFTMIHDENQVTQKIVLICLYDTSLNSKPRNICFCLFKTSIDKCSVSA